MRTPSGLAIDNPSWPLLQAVISYWSITSAAGTAGGTTLVDANLANEPSYDGLTLKILSGPAAGQARTIQTHVTTTLTVGVGFTNAAGAAQQITAGVLYVVLSALGGGGGPGPAPEESLTYYGIVDAAPGVNQFTINALVGLGAGKFAGATNPYVAFVLRDAGGASAAPQGQLQPITAYVTATGVFTTAAFTAAVAVGDEILILHPSLASLLLAPVIVASGTFTASSATVPADAARLEADNHFRGMLLIPTAGAMQWRATRIVAFANVGGVFTIDPNNPFPAATGLVTYVVVRDQSDFVPAADAAINRTPSDVAGNKTDTIPAMNLAPGATDSLVRHIKAILERVGATPADLDDSLLTTAGQRDDVATLDDMSALDTASLHAKIRRVLLRLAPNVFSATVQGVARTALDDMVDALATYMSAAGAAYSATVDPGGAARTNIEQTLEDIGAILAGAGITTYPAGAVPANGVSIAAALRQVYLDQVVPGADAVANAYHRDVVGNKTDTAIYVKDAVSSIMRYLKGLLDATVTAWGTADAGSGVGQVRDAARTEANDWWNAQTILMLTGAAAFQKRPISDFVAATDDILVSPNFDAAVAAGDIYVILAHYNQIVPRTADDTANALTSDAVGRKDDTPDYTPGATTSSIVRLLKGVLGANVVAEGTFTTSDMMNPVDTSRTETEDFFRGAVLMPVAGAAAFQQRAIKNFAVAAADAFTLEEPFSVLPGLVAYVVLSQYYPIGRLEAATEHDTRDKLLKQAYNTTTTVRNATIVLFALDALDGPKKDVRVEFYLVADAAATFTPAWYVTREGDQVTFVVRSIPAIATIATPAAAARYSYQYGDLPEGAQLELRVAQDNLGNATNAIDGALTYLG